MLFHLRNSIVNMLSLWPTLIFHFNVHCDGYEATRGVFFLPSFLAAAFMQPFMGNYTLVFKPTELVWFVSMPGFCDGCSTSNPWTGLTLVPRI